MQSSVVNTVTWPDDAQQAQEQLTREWLVTNGLGGYASGSVAGVCTRRYHGLLVAALPSPAGRTVMLTQLAETLALPDGRLLRLTGEERPGAPCLLPEILREFRLELGLPVWRYEVDGLVLEKRLLMPYGQNAVVLQYALLQGGEGACLLLQPRLNFRPHEAPVSQPPAAGMRVQVHGRQLEAHAGDGIPLPPLRMLLPGTDVQWLPQEGRHEAFFHRVEAARGYPDQGTLWAGGSLRVPLAAGGCRTLIASTQAWDSLLALEAQPVFAQEHQRREHLLAQADPAARSDMAAQLVLAADQFIISASSRHADAARAHPEGSAARTVIAGYHWFTDWGRDTMISLEGLTLSTGRHDEARSILRTFLHYVRDGLIPNMFPEGQNEGLYHTADATLWFFHAMDRYLAATGDQALLQQALPVLRSIVEHHLRGTRFRIGVDARDGLLTQGAPDLQLTWMDAKVDGWVVTPRRGKAVELNALFYNALRLTERWLGEAGDGAAAAAMAQHAGRLRASFNQRFWNPQTGCLFDLVDGEQGDDAAIRPNMLFAIALPHPVLDPTRWEAVLQVARDTLLTPVGLRSLAPGHPDYQRRYDGDLRTRDAAYHQGTVWGWLAGPFADAWLRAHPGDPAPVQALVEGFAEHLGEACLGSISEVFDAEAPFTPRGCVAQAWSVAEVLRLLVKLRAGG